MKIFNRQNNTKFTYKKVLQLCSTFFILRYSLYYICIVIKSKTMKRVNHKIYGYGTVLEDKEQLCHNGELLVKFDNSTNRLEAASASKAFSKSAYTEIVLITDLID